MFTGLIEEVGTVLWIRATDKGTQLQIAAPRVAKKMRTGDSVAANGCCLTLSAHRGEQLTFDLLQETLDRTNLKNARRDSRVNLERAFAPGDRVGGHFVQGHVDCVTPVVGVGDQSGDLRVEMQLPAEFAHYVVPKGSIAVNGISLTVGEVTTTNFSVYIIPHTRRHTNLDHLRPGALLNLEFDIVAKYVERMLARAKETMTMSPPPDGM
jgi:riboflavin synthase